MVLRVGGLVAAVEQYDLFAPPGPIEGSGLLCREREERLQKAVDRVREKWGLPLVLRASSLPAAFGCDAAAAFATGTGAGGTASVEPAVGAELAERELIRA